MCFCKEGLEESSVLLGEAEVMECAKVLFVNERQSASLKPEQKEGDREIPKKNK